MTRPAIAYVRVSTEEQARDGQSLAAQRAAIANWAAANAVDVVAWHEDAGVGSAVPFEDRPAGKCAFAALARGDADMLVVTAVDRMFRDTGEGLRFFDWAAARQVAVHSLREAIDSRTAAGRMGLTMTLAVARYERDVIAERTRAALQAMRARGQVVGQVPFGFRKGQGGYLERCPTWWPVRMAVVDEYLHGRQEDGRRHSFRSLGWTLFARGVKPPSGRMWSTNTLRTICLQHAHAELLPVVSA